VPGAPLSGVSFPSPPLKPNILSTLSVKFQQNSHLHNNVNFTVAKLSSQIVLKNTTGLRVLLKRDHSYHADSPPAKKSLSSAARDGLSTCASVIFVSFDSNSFESDMRSSVMPLSVSITCSGSVAIGASGASSISTSFSLTGFETEEAVSIWVGKFR
jgi:hypothetical protein